MSDHGGKAGSSIQWSGVGDPGHSAPHRTRQVIVSLWPLVRLPFKAWLAFAPKFAATWYGAPIIRTVTQPALDHTTARGVVTSTSAAGRCERANNVIKE